MFFALFWLLFWPSVRPWFGRVCTSFVVTVAFALGSPATVPSFAMLFCVFRVACFVVVVPLVFVLPFVSPCVLFLVAPFGLAVCCRCLTCVAAWRYDLAFTNSNSYDAMDHMGRWGHSKKTLLAWGRNLLHIAADGIKQVVHEVCSVPTARHRFLPKHTV